MSTLHTVERGEGPGVLLIHGAGPDLRAWEEVLGDLSADHHVVAYNRRGYPDSGAPEADWNRHIDDAIELIESHSLAPATVVGHSAGSIPATGVAVRRPDLVARLVLIDPILHAQKRPTFSLIRTVLKVQRMRKRDPEGAMEVFFDWATSHTDGTPPSWRRLPQEDQAAMRGRHEVVFADMDAGDGSKQISRDQLGRLHNVTIASAELTDRWFSKNAKALAHRIPDVKLESILGSGHAATLDNPARVTEIIRSG